MSRDPQREPALGRHAQFRIDDTSGAAPTLHDLVDVPVFLNPVEARVTSCAVLIYHRYCSQSLTIDALPLIRSEVGDAAHRTDA